jgi:hypothetical protein
MEHQIRYQDQQTFARYRQDYASERASRVIFDLVDSDNMLERQIASLVRDGDTQAAEQKAKTPTPIQTINELFDLSNIPLQISLEERQKLVARRHADACYSIVELSDGERNAFLIAAEVLTAPPESLILLDEPERHLHRSIISPLLTALFQKRPDCAFVVSTHEISLPVDNADCRTLLVRSCTYQGADPHSWSANLLEPNAPITEELKRDILGSRHKVLFVEGTPQSLDAPLYSIIFPDVSVIPKASCRDVENSVSGLRESSGLVWLHPWGIVDNDRRAENDITRLRAFGVHALPYFSVESLYFHTKMIEQIAQRQASVTGEDHRTLVEKALKSGIEEAQRRKEYLVQNAIDRLVRQEILAKLPKKDELRSKNEITISVDLDAIRSREAEAFDSLMNNRDLLTLLQRYPLRESGALKNIAGALGLERSRYEAAVRKLLKEDENALIFMRSLFNGLYEEVVGTP